ncbi:hypothetical protein L7F22_056848 [Adiantum nelumboides]|nr:hypothetical protein [Adiantum nelumboides]
MGICMSKGECVQRANKSGRAEESELQLASSRTQCNVRALNQEVNSYNLFFDEWGAVNIHMPETIATFPAQEDRSNISQLLEQAQLYSREVYGALSYLSSPFKDPQLSCAPSTAPRMSRRSSDMLPAISFNRDSHSILEIGKPALGADSSRRDSKLSENVSSGFENGLGGSCNPVQRVESARRPSLCSEGMLSFKLRDFVDEDYSEADCARDSSGSFMSINGTVSAAIAQCTTANGVGEIGVFEAEKYFKVNDQHKLDQEPALTAKYMHGSGPAVMERTTSATSSACGSEAHDTASFYQDYRNSTAASSDVSYDSRSALSGARRVASSSDALWSSSPSDSKSNRCTKSKMARPSHSRNRNLSSMGRKWFCCSSCRADDTLDEGSDKVSRRSQQHSVEGQEYALNTASCPPPTDADLAALTKKLALPMLSKYGDDQIVHGLPAQPSSPSQRLMNLLGKPKNGSCRSHHSSSRLGILHPQRTSSQDRIGSFSEDFFEEHGKSGQSPSHAQSPRKPQQSIISGVIHLPNGSLHASHHPHADVCIESSEGYTHTTAEVQEHVYSIWSPLQRPDVWQDEQSVLPSSCRLMSSSSLPQTRADAIANPYDMAGRDISQITPSTSSILFPCQAAHLTWITNKREEFCKCSLLEDSILSIKADSRHAESEAEAPLESDPTLCHEVMTKNESFANADHAHEPEVHERSKSNMQARDYRIKKQSECFTFPDLGCLVSANLSVNRHSSNITSRNREQGISHLLKVQSLEEMKHLEVFPIGTKGWNKGCHALEAMDKESRSSSFFGGSTPTCSTGGLGSAFGSPFSVAMSCPSSDHPSQDEFAMSVSRFSQQSHGFEPIIYKPLDGYGMPADGSPLNEQNGENQEVHHMGYGKHLAGVTLDDDDDDDIDDDEDEETLTSSCKLTAFQGRGFMNEVGIIRSAAMCMDEEVYWSKEEYQEIDSDSSSDLFDLDNLGGRVKIMERAERALPVFEVPKSPASKACATRLHTHSLDDSY